MAMYQNGGRFASGFGMDSSPPALPKHTRRAAPLRTPGTSEKGWATAADFDQYDRGERDAEHESVDEDDGVYASRHQQQCLATTQAGSARALVSNGLIAVAPVGDEANRPTNAQLRAKMAQYGITRRSEAFVDLKDDRGIRMSILFHETIGYVYNPRVRNGNSKSRDKMSPLILSLGDFKKLSREEQEIRARQKRQRDNLFIRAANMLMGVGNDEKCPHDIGVHTNQTKSDYASRRKGGSS